MNKILDFNEFGTSSIESWRGLVQKELKDLPFDSLIWKNDNDIIAEPYLTGYVAQYRVPERSVSVWKISQTIEGNDLATMHATTMEALSGGAQRIVLRGAVRTKEELNSLLKDVLIDIVAIEYTASDITHALDLSSWIVELASQRGLNPKTLEGSIRIPQNELLANDEALVELAKFASQHLSLFKVMVIDSDKVHQSNGNDVQELASQMALANELIQRLIQGGLTIDHISALFLFSFETGTSYFVQIAKLQAFRALWSTLVKAYEPQHACSEHCMIEARNSERDQSEKDVYNNVLRATTEAISAIVGGADYVDVCFPEQFAKGFTEKSSRLGRNIMHILAEESYLTSLKNPIKGAWYIEQLVDQLIEKSWELFQQIENRGGALECGEWLNSEIQKMASMRKEQFETGQKVMVGVNKYMPKP